MPKMAPGGESAKSARASDVMKGKQPSSVHNIERVGGKGKGTHSFNVPNHPDKSKMSSPED